MLNPNICHTDNVDLYLATITAFGDKSHKYIDVSDHSEADGLLLWSRLDFIMGDKTTYKTQELVLCFHQLKRQNNQSIQSFGHSFLSQIEVLSHHKVKVGTVKDLAFRFLVAVNMPKLFKNQIKDIDAYQSWWKNKPLRAFIDKVCKEYESEKRLGSLDNAYLIMDTTAETKKEHQNDNRKQEQPSKQQNNQRNNTPSTKCS